MAQRGVEVWLYFFVNLGVSFVWVVKATPRPLYPRARHLLRIFYEDGWAPGPV
jgi:hypothetical protein